MKHRKKKKMRRKPIWLTCFCLIVILVAFLGIVWIVQDTYKYQNTLKLVKGNFDYYETVTNRYFTSEGVRTQKQGNLILNGTCYTIASDSLSDFDIESFQEKIGLGDQLVIQVTDDHVVYSVQDANGTNFLSLATSQTNSANDNMVGIVLCISIIIIMLLFWRYYR